MCTLKSFCCHSKFGMFVVSSRIVSWPVCLHIARAARHYRLSIPSTNIILLLPRSLMVMGYTNTRCGLRDVVSVALKFTLTVI